MSDLDETVDSVESQEEVTEPQENVDAEENENINETEFSETADGEDGNPEKDDEEITKPQVETKKKQSKQENSMFAQKRREQEAIIKRREDEAYKKARLDLLIGENNQYTGEKIEDEDDVEEYLLMKEAEKAGFDPATELSKYQKQKARNERKAKETVGFDVEADKKSFVESYPDVNLSELVSDKDFASFAEPFAQKVPLAVIYNQYNLMKSRIESQARSMAEEKYKRKLASPGSLSNSSQEKPLSVNDMSDEEFENLLKKAKRGDLMKS